jgi:predicted solute-binding protein
VRETRSYRWYPCMALRIGCVPSLRVEPFYFHMARRVLALTELVPRAVTVAAANGEIDAGPVPLVDCFRLEDRVQPVAGLCVASVQDAGSSLLFSTKPIAALAGAHIGVTDEASTALRLLDVLLGLKYQVQTAPNGPLQASHVAFLLIGNQGLRQRMGVPGFSYTYDLGTEWHAWTGLPFVFSHWMVRKDVSPRDRALIGEALYVGREEGVDVLCQPARPREDLLMLPRDIVMHIQGSRYYIGRSEQRAIEQFQHHLQ